MYIKITNMRNSPNPNLIVHSTPNYTSYKISCKSTPTAFYESLVKR